MKDGHLLIQAVKLILQFLASNVSPVQNKKSCNPLADWGQNVTQPYGNPNSNYYPTTGHHIGVDHPSPIGTPVLAPRKGKIVQVGHHETMGEFAVFQYRHNRWLVMAHLAIGSCKPQGTELECGDVIATIGNTGLVSGVHSHIEVWCKNPVKREILPKDFADNWREYTLDPIQEFK